jgi:hypothetical protein
MSDPIKFQSADERIAWDRYLVAAVAEQGYGPGTDPFGMADEMLLARRERDGGHVNMATDSAPYGALGEITQAIREAGGVA